MNSAHLPHIQPPAKRSSQLALRQQRNGPPEWVIGVFFMICIFYLLISTRCYRPENIALHYVASNFDDFIAPAVAMLNKCCFFCCCYFCCARAAHLLFISASQWVSFCLSAIERGLKFCLFCFLLWRAEDWLGVHCLYVCAPKRLCVCVYTVRFCYECSWFMVTRQQLFS